MESRGSSGHTALAWSLPAVLMLVGAMAVPVHADHVPPTEIRWACGFGGSGQTGHPSQCGINPVGGGFDVGEDGPVMWGDAWTKDDELILGLVVNGASYAVPVTMLDSHEIANIDVGGVAIAVTYCPLCGSGVAFLRDVVVDGTTTTLSFAASGFLYQDDLVMWDPQTETLWNQISGSPIGSLDGETVVRSHMDARLDTIPLLVATSAEWHESYPESLMLQKVRSAYGNPYGSYAESGDRCGLSSCAGTDGRLHPKELVIGVAGPYPIAFPVSTLTEPVVATLDGMTYVAVKAEGGGHRVLNGTGIGLTQSVAGWVDAEGDTWDLAANRDSAGDALAELPSLRLFWFAWEGHYPETILWTADGEAPPAEFDNGRLPGFYIPIVAGFLVLGALVYRWRR